MVNAAETSTKAPTTNNGLVTSPLDFFIIFGIAVSGPIAKPQTIMHHFDDMQKFLITLTLIIWTFSIFPQDKKIILKIDTLNFVDKYKDFLEFKITVGKQGFLNFGDSADSTNICFNTYPNFITKLILKSDSSTIQIPFDNENGYFEILNAYKMQDYTLRINKYTLYSNCYRDTSYTTIDYYIKKTDGSIGKPYKSKQTKSIEKSNCKNRPPLKTAYSINGQQYLVSIQKHLDIGVEITNFHGYLTKKYLKNPDNYKGEVKYFHGHSTKRHYINLVRLKIKNGA